AIHRDPQIPRPSLILADCDHRSSERRAQDEAHKAYGERETEHDEVVKRVGIREDVDGRDPQMERLPRESAQSVIAARDPAPLERDVVEHLAEGNGHHRKIDTAPPRDQRTEQRAGYTTQKRPAD